MIRSRFAVSALTGAALLLPLAATGAQAQTYRNNSASSAPQSYEACVASQRNRQVAGAVIGGVLGAVIGAEVHDDRQDRDRERNYRGRDRHRDYYGRGYRRGDRYDRGHGYKEDGNDGAVLAGAGLGALAGAAISGRGNGCEHLRNAGYGGGYDQGGYAYPDQGYQNGGYQNNGYQGGYDQGYDQRTYRNSSASQGELLGGESYGYDEPAQPYLDQPYQPQFQPGPQARSYTASSGAQTGAQPGGACRNMGSSNGSVTWMCQGADGVWRPASTY